MKRILTLFFFALCLFFCLNSSAQECSTITSGPSVCTAAASLPAPGFYPSEDSLPCIIDGVAYDTVIQFKSPPTALGYTIKTIVVTKITNLPCGICWAMGETNNTINVNTNPDGCIRIQGTTYDAPGQYLVKVYANVTVTVPILGSITENNVYVDSVADLKYWGRVRLPNGPCALVDTNVMGLSASTSGTVDTPGISGTTSICAGDSTTLTATGTGYFGYVWSTGAQTSSIKVGAAGTYTVTVFGGCWMSSRSVTVTVSTPATPTITANGATTFCQGDSVKLTSSSATTYHWSTGATTQAITATISGNYTVVTTNANGCSATSTVTVVTVNANPSNTVTPSGPITFCSGGSVTLTAASGLTYSWSNSTTGQSINVTQSGTYKVTVSNANNCSATSTPITVTVNPVPNDTIAANGPITFCAGGSVALNAATGLTYHWSNGLTTSGITVTQSGTYDVSLTATGGCTAVSNSITVTVNPLPDDTVTVTGATTFCVPGSVTLTAPSGLSYSWTGGSSSQSIVVSQTGSYSVTVSNGNNCSAVSTPIAVTANPLPNDTVALNGPTTFCAGGSITLTAAAGNSYHWSNNASSQSITVGQSGNYSVTLTTANNCTAASAPDSITVNPNPSNAVTTSGPVSFCQGGSVTLTAAAGNTYLWSNTTTSQGITVSQTGSYIVTVSNTYNCSVVSTPVTVTANALPNDTITANGPLTFCSGDSVILTAAPGLIYLWSNNATTQNITVYQSGNYSVTVSNSNNCSAVSGIDTVTVNTSPGNTVTVSGPTTFCTGDSVTLTAPAGFSYGWSNSTSTQSITVTQNGSYTVTVSAANNCSAVSSPVAVVVNALPSDTVNISGTTTFCAGNNVVLTATAGANYLWSNTATTQSITVSSNGSYTVTVTNGNNCSAVSSPVSVTVNLLTAVTTPPVSQITCLGGDVNFTVAASGTGLTYQWLFNGILTGVTTNTYNVPSASTADTGTYVAIVNGLCGSDTTQPATLTLTNSITISQQPVSQTACAGSRVTLSVIANGANSSFQWQQNGQPITGADSSTYIIFSMSIADTGSYLCSITSSCGDTISDTAVIGINYPVSYSYTDTTCAGSYTFNGQVLTTSGIFIDTLTASNGCDSIVTLGLTFLPILHNSISGAICAGSGYNFNGTMLTAGGTYTDTLLSFSGCDSVVTLNLVINQPAVNNISATICSGSYNFNGQILTLAGNYSDTLTGSNTCDSIVNLTLTVNQPSSFAFSQTICSGSNYNFNGQILTTGGNYNDTLLNAQGCDSIVTLTLTVNPPIDSVMNVAICAGSTYLFNGQYLSVASTYYDTLVTGNGCDSIVILQLGILPVPVTNLTASICAGSSYSFNGVSLTTGGNYADTLNAANGCDSIVNLVLTINQANGSAIQQTICAGSSYNFNGNTLTTQDTYYDTLQNVNGCDSVVTLVLTVQQAITSAVSASICQGSGYSFNGQTITIAGNYIDTLTTGAGCDSIVTLTLTVNHPTATVVNANICSGAQYNFNGTSVSTAGTYYDTLSTSGGCDSIVQLNLQVSTSISTSYSAFVCQGSTYNFNGVTLTAGGTYTDTLQANGGCDSIVTLHLTIHPSATYQFSASICAGLSYNFNGQQLTAAGVYHDTLFTQYGCDSIVTLTLVVNPVITTQLGIVVCNGSTYNFNGQILNTAGTYVDTLISAAGCDSIVVLTLQLNGSIHTSIYDTICGGSTFNFNGNTLSTAGAYFDTLTAVGGCDSIVALNLAVLPVQSNIINQTICQGSTYYFNGQHIAVSGTFSDTAQSVHGCDSVTTLNLVINGSPIITWTGSDTLCDNNSLVITLPAASPAGGTYTGAGVSGDVLTATGAGSYPVTYLYIDTANCSGTETRTFVVETCTGISQLNLESSITLYPNPVNDMVTIQSNLFTAFTVTPVIYSVTGQIIEAPFTRDGDKIIFNTARLTAGMYWVRLTVNDISSSRKFIKAD